jgi:hypothetical protein
MSIGDFKSFVGEGELASTATQQSIDAIAGNARAPGFGVG